MSQRYSSVLIFASEDSTITKRSSHSIHRYRFFRRKQRMISALSHNVMQKSGIFCHNGVVYRASSYENVHHESLLGARQIYSSSYLCVSAISGYCFTRLQCAYAHTRFALSAAVTRTSRQAGRQALARGLSADCSCTAAWTVI